MNRVLIIEDEAQIRQNFLEILELEGFEAYGAENGEIGLDVIDHNQLDLVICDLLMPGMDGAEVLRAVRETPHTEYLPFIVVTANTDLGRRDEVLNIGATAVLTKPVDLDVLLDAIRESI